VVRHAERRHEVAEVLGAAEPGERLRGGDPEIDPSLLAQHRLEDRDGGRIAGGRERARGEEADLRAHPLLAHPLPQAVERQLTSDAVGGVGEPAAVAPEEIAVGVRADREERERARRLGAQPPAAAVEDAHQEAERALVARLAEVPHDEQTAASSGAHSSASRTTPGPSPARARNARPRHGDLAVGSASAARSARASVAGAGRRLWRRRRDGRRRRAARGCRSGRRSRRARTGRARTPGG
jgi:hypothetical protein